MIRFSAVVDLDFKFIHQARNWISTLLLSGTGTHDEIILHLIEGIDPIFVLQLERNRIKYRTVKPYGKGAAVYCNKLVQLGSTELESSDFVVLNDTDILYSDNIRHEIESTRTVKAKIVDYANPPLKLLRKALKGVAVKNNKVVKSNFKRNIFDTRRTIADNCNGGVYIFKGAMLPKFKKNWTFYSNKILQKDRVLKDYTKHADQIGFALAIQELGVSREELDVVLNYPLSDSHRYKWSKYPGQSIKVVHYHGSLNEHGMIEFRDHFTLREKTSVARINEMILEGNEQFWS